jgi:hypothetical protein
MASSNSVKSAILATILVLIAVTSWEMYLRGKGIKPDYDDSPELWADKRAMVYEPANKATVFIGSSRMKYGLDVTTWENIAHTHAIQLSMVGSSPLLFLDDLANDPNFKGRLIVDVTEVLFFATLPYASISPAEGIDFYRKRTPAQKASFAIDHALESELVFLNQANFSLNALLNKLPIKNRPGAYPRFDFPIDFSMTLFSRQNYMTPKFLTDTNLQNQVKGIWFVLSRMGGPPPISGKALEGFIQHIKDNVDKIRARGGDVLFLRTPCSGPMLMAENQLYPKNAYWDKLLTGTGCKGIYYADYPSLAHFYLPEFSHLTPEGAIRYTKGIIDILEKENKTTPHGF